MKKIFKTLMIATIALIAISTTSCQKGETGPKGSDGNANVISSNEVTLSSSDWTLKTTTSGSKYYLTIIDWPILTKDIANKGVVMCYLKLGTDVWIALPWDDYYFFFTEGGIAINYNYNANPGTQTIRLVAIPSSQLVNHPDLNIKDYRQVKEIFNIPQ